MKGKVWLPGMGANHELDWLFNFSNLLILKGIRSRQKPQKQPRGTKSVQTFIRWNSKSSENWRRRAPSAVSGCRKAGPAVVQDGKRSDLRDVRSMRRG